MSLPKVITEISRKLRKNMTPSEKKLWVHIREQKLGLKFLRQKPIHIFTEDYGLKRYIIADFYNSEHKIIIEIDGNIHEDSEVINLDKEKEKLLQQSGYRVERFTNNEIYGDMKGVINKISSLLEKGRCPKDRGDVYLDQVQIFLDTPSDKQKLVVIYGPTGSGKTAMSIDIAKYLNTEIISTDSRQIFKYMDIGTGKITPDETEGIKHHMIDIVEPSEEFSMGEFVRQSSGIMDRLWGENKVPMLVGGTGLYIDSLIFERNAAEVSSDPELRKQLDTLSSQELYEKLEEIDPEYAAELHPNNRPYIERGIEVMKLTGKSKKEFRAQKKLLYDVLFLTPEAPEGIIYREWLYSRINRRVEMMFDDGAEREVRELLQKGYSFDDFGMNSIGYREFREYISGDMNREEVISKIQQNSRNYAKRQLTWFRKYEDYKSKQISDIKSI